MANESGYGPKQYEGISGTSIDHFCPIMKSPAKVFRSAFREIILPFNITLAAGFLIETNVLSFCFGIGENISGSSTSNLFETNCLKTTFPLSKVPTRSATTHSCSSHHTAIEIDDAIFLKVVLKRINHFANCSHHILYLLLVSIYSGNINIFSCSTSCETQTILNKNNLQTIL